MNLLLLLLLLLLLQYATHPLLHWWRRHLRWGEGRRQNPRTLAVPRLHHRGHHWVCA